MFKNFFSTLFSSRVTRRPSHTGKKLKFAPVFFKKKSPARKYHKRKKNILQKLGNRLDFFPFVSLKNILFGGIVFIFVTIVIILFYSPLTIIKNINIYREGSLIDINRAYGQVDYLRGKNTLRIDTKQIAQRLQKSQISLSKIKIDVHFPSSIDITLGTYDTIFQTNNFFILSNGSIVEKQNETIPSVPFLGISDDISEYLDFQRTLSPIELKTIQSLILESEKNILGFTASQVYYFIKEREVIIRDASTLYIFDISDNIAEQVRKLAIYKTEAETPEFQAIYIDARIPEKIFLCSNESRNICENNIKNIYGDDVIQNLFIELSESPQ